MKTLTHRSLALRLVLAVLLGAVATAAVPQQPPAATPAPPATATPPPAAEAAPPATPAATPPAPAPKAPAGTPSPARFEPTDKVRADFDVSFPIDI